MTSVLKRFSQIETRIKYFNLIADCSGYVIPYSSAQPIMDISGFNAVATTKIGFTAGAQLQDLGRQITVYNSHISGSPHVALFRQVILVSPTSPYWEGLNLTNQTAYICIWAAPTNTSPIAYTPALVARVG